LHGTDESRAYAIGIVNHLRGNIAIELLKNGLGKICKGKYRFDLKCNILLDSY